MFLDYLALIILLIGLVLVFYTFIYIHDLPHTIAEARHHPHEEAIHVACWLSLFTLHAIWPIVYIWAVSHKKPGAAHAAHGSAAGEAKPEIGERLVELERRLKKLEGATGKPTVQLEKVT
jgi:Protein of unknown function (DUF3302)